MAVRTYAPEDVTVSLALVHQVTDFAEGQGISLEKDESVFSTNKGAKGHVERIHTPDRTYTLTLSLAQTSPTNAVLTAMYTVDDASRLGMFPIFIKDSSGQSVFTSPTCWIEGIPPATYSSGIETREWNIKCANTVFGLAGNTTERSAIESAGLLATYISQYATNLGVF